MLDSLKAKEEIEDTKRNADHLFSSTKVNFLFLFYCFALDFQCNILNTVFLVHNVMILAGAYPTLMGVNLCMNFLTSSTRAAMNTFIDKDIQLSAIAYDVVMMTHF